MLLFTRAANEVRRLFHRSRAEQELDAELRDFLEMSTEQKMRAGMSREAALRAARLEVGSVPAVKDHVRDVGWLSVFESVWRDLGFAFRLIGKERWFSATVIGALALGIGINAVGFTLVNAAFLRGLPFEESERLLMLSLQTTRAGRRSDVSYVELQDWREQIHTFSGLAAFTNAAVNISDDLALPEQARGTWVTANTFGVLRQQPLIGRDFALDDERRGAERVAIVSYNIWKNRYGSDTGVLGRSLRLNGEVTTIIGVMPDRMRFPNNTDVWAPFVPTPAQESRSVRLLSMFGRLQNGVTRREAETDLNGVAHRMAAAYPEVSKDLLGARTETFTERFVGGAARPVLLTAMGAVGFVLLIACANVANLLLSRSAYRAREIAVRIALGATRWRVVRQLLLESVVLGVIGGSIGLLLAIGGVGVLDAAVQDPDKPYWINFTVDYVVIAYVAAICVLTGILFGLAPALHVSKTNMNDVLKEGGRGSAGGARTRSLSGAMVVAELALTVVLLAGAGLMIRSFMKVHAMDLGIRTDQLMTMQMQLAESKYANAEARRAFYERIELRLAAIPGVEAIAVTTAVPPFGFGQRSMEIDGQPARPPDELQRISTVTISPRFFETVRAPMRRGRAFGEMDGAPGSETVVVNERMAAQFFPGQDPIGRRLRFAPTEGASSPATEAWRTIVGVSPSIRHGSFQDVEPSAVVYLPLRQDPSRSASLLVRSPLPPSAVMEAVRGEVRSIDRDQPVFSFRTLDQAVAADRSVLNVFSTLFVIFGAIGLALSAVGLYAVMAYSVTQRTQEIGVRMALGADGRQVSWLILKRGLAHLAIGLTIGLAGALAVSQVLQKALIQITPGDPVTFASITILLTVVCAAACLIPARRATRVDPLVALRAD